MSDNPLRNRIIEEATGLFARLGYAKTSVRAIMEAAEATKPTLYYYFGNKEGLFKATLDYHLSRFNLILKELAGQEERPVLERLLEYLQVSIRLGAENPNDAMVAPTLP